MKTRSIKLDQQLFGDLTKAEKRTAFTRFLIAAVIFTSILYVGLQILSYNGVVISHDDLPVERTPRQVSWN